MLVFSFIMSIIFAIVLITFTIALIVITMNQKKLKDSAESQIEDMINGFKTLDLGGIHIDREKEKKE